MRRPCANFCDCNLQAQSCKTALVGDKKALEDKLMLAHQEPEAAAAGNKELYDRLHAVNKASEERSRVAICEADQRVAAFQVCTQPVLTGLDKFITAACATD